MKIIYEADDGTRFEDEDVCYAYEAVCRFPEFVLIDFYDENDNMYHINKVDPFNDSTYHRCEKINVHTVSELYSLHWIAHECGWCEFEDQITRPGIWIRETKNGIFSDAEWRKI